LVIVYVTWQNEAARVVVVPMKKLPASKIARLARMTRLRSQLPKKKSRSLCSERRCILPSFGSAKLERASLVALIQQDAWAGSEKLSPLRIFTDARVQRARNYERLHTTLLSLKDVGEGLLPLHEPLKPGLDESVVPGAMEALYEALVMVTALPDWVKEPFQSCVIV
jgi:hypothetical protein